MSSGDEDARKLFLGGLPTNATKEQVQEYFSQFGEIQMCTIKTDVYTNRSRGFGFLIFEDVSSVEQVLNYPGKHTICDKEIDPKKATPQENREDKQKSTKVFVGGLDKSTTEDDIRSAFSTRGTVTDVYLPIDKLSNEAKGFAFVTFDSSDIVATLTAEGKFDICGKEVDVKAAKDKNESQRGGRGGFRGGRGGFQGRGGGRGGYGGGFDQYGNNYGSYDQYGGSGYGGYQGGGGNYGGGNYGGSGYQGGYGGGGYDQYNGSSYGGPSGYDGSGYGGGYDQNGSGGYGGQDQYKMKGSRGRGGGYNPY